MFRSSKWADSKGSFGEYMWVSPIIACLHKYGNNLIFGCYDSEIVKLKSLFILPRTQSLQPIFDLQFT